MAEYIVYFTNGAKRTITCESYHVMPITDGGNGSQSVPEVMLYNGTGDENGPSPDFVLVGTLNFLNIAGIVKVI